jgi:hypothetical protein
LEKPSPQPVLKRTKLAPPDVDHSIFNRVVDLVVLDQATSAAGEEVVAGTAAKRIYEKFL